HIHRLANRYDHMAVFVEFEFHNWSSNLIDEPSGSLRRSASADFGNKKGPCASMGLCSCSGVISR
ncbi:hypothetical protein ACOZB2_24985, partial [Pantoea endophytica]